MTEEYELHLAGRAPVVLVEQIRGRFGDVGVRRDRDRDRTVLTGTVLDQSALRALLSLVWDGGGDVLALVVDGHDRWRTS